MNILSLTRSVGWLVVGVICPNHVLHCSHWVLSVVCTVQDAPKSSGLVVPKPSQKDPVRGINRATS